ncbi:MAG: cysteine-rich CWC family protein [Rubrivivax sp.]|nr:cysteine-rich CWC family protein [Rubrivivax sp.]
MNAPAADAVCPRCGGAFHCGARDAAPCACTTVRLDATTLAALRERWSACLCVECLTALAAGEAPERSSN